MAEHIKPIELGDTSELLQVAEEVHRSHMPRILRHAGEDLAIVVPLPQLPKTRGRRREKTEADYEAFRNAAGSWKDIDTGKLSLHYEMQK